MQFIEAKNYKLWRLPGFIKGAISGVVLILFLATLVRAQRLPVKIYTSADGLGSSFINFVMRDSRGFLWFATRDGLSRFDGRQFTTYKVGAENAPPGIERICETRSGIYWITTTSGLYRFDPNLKKDSSAAADSAKNIIEAEFISPLRGEVYEDSRGRLLLGGGGLFQIEESNGKFNLREQPIDFPDESWKKYPFIKLFETMDGSLWLVARNGLIRQTSDAKTFFYKFPGAEKDMLNDAMADASGNVWTATGSAAYIFKPAATDGLPAEEKTFVHNFELPPRPASVVRSFLPERADEIVKFAAADPAGGDFRRIFESADHHIWMTSSSSLLEFDGNSIKNYGAGQGLATGLTDIVEDTSGNLWLGGQNGVTRFNRFGMYAYTKTEGLDNSTIHSIYSREGNLFIVNGEAAVSRFNGFNFETVRLQIDPHSTFAWLSNVAFLDSRGEWWALTEDKLYRFAAPENFSDLGREKPSAVYTKADGLKGNMFFRIFEDGQGNLWFATHDRDPENIGLTKWTRADEKFHVFGEGDGIPKGKSPASFAEEPDGTLWFGYYEEGLTRYKDGKFSEVTEPLPKGFFTSIHFDRQGRLWLASSQSGVTRYDDPKDLTKISAVYNTGSGLSSNNVRSMTEDAEGNIYAGTARGIDRISPGTGSLRHFSANDGLAGDFVSTAFANTTGALWFGTPNGLSRFNPEIESRTTLPPAQISGLRVAGENRFVPPLGASEIPELEFAANQNNLQVDFFAVDFSAGDAVSYQYKLEGADEDWSRPTNQRTVNYANLAPGKYRFLVRTINAEGAVSENPATIPLYILAPFYRRPPFIAAVVLLGLLGVFALDRYRVSKTRQVKAALDVSQKSEQAARISETRYRTLAETASDAIITINEASEIVYVNEAAEKIFGFKPVELVGKPLTELMPESLRGGHDQGFGHYLSTNRKNLVWSAIELPGRHKSGREIPLELSFGEFESGGQRFFTGIIRDVSERKRAEAALEKARAERLAELERVRSRIARDLHDDVGSSLTQIALFSEVARQSGHGENEEPLEFLVETSKELVEAMSDIVWAINPNKDRFQDLTLRMRRFASEILSAAEIDLDFAAPETGTETPLGANLRREVFLIFKESINNIVKHSGASAVDIDFSLAHGDLDLRIKDNGKGFETQEKPADAYDWRAAKGGNGLPGMKRRAAELGGDLTVNSSVENGTEIILRVALDDLSKTFT